MGKNVLDFKIVRAKRVTESTVMEKEIGRLNALVGQALSQGENLTGEIIIAQSRNVERLLYNKTVSR